MPYGSAVDAFSLTTKMADANFSHFGSSDYIFAYPIAYREILVCACSVFPPGNVFVSGGMGRQGGRGAGGGALPFQFHSYLYSL